MSEVVGTVFTPAGAVQFELCPEVGMREKLWAALVIARHPDPFEGRRTWMEYLPRTDTVLVMGEMPGSDGWDIVRKYKVQSEASETVEELERRGCRYEETPGGCPAYHLTADGGPRWVRMSCPCSGDWRDGWSLTVRLSDPPTSVTRMIERY